MLTYTPDKLRNAERRLELPRKCPVTFQCPAELVAAKDTFISTGSAMEILRFRTPPDQFVAPAHGDGVDDKFLITTARLPFVGSKKAQQLVNYLSGKHALPNECGVPGPGMMIERSHIRNESRAKWVEMDVADQFEQISITIANDRFIAVLKQVTGAAVAAIEIDRIAGEQATHEMGKIALARTQQEVEMIGQQCPGKTIGMGSNQQCREAIEKPAAVVIVKENVAAVDPTYDDVLEQVGEIEASGTWHGRMITEGDELGNN